MGGISAASMEFHQWGPLTALRVSGSLDPAFTDYLRASGFNPLSPRGEGREDSLRTRIDSALKRAFSSDL